MTLLCRSKISEISNQAFIKSTSIDDWAPQAHEDGWRVSVFVLSPTENIVNKIYESFIKSTLTIAVRYVKSANATKQVEMWLNENHVLSGYAVLSAFILEKVVVQTSMKVFHLHLPVFTFCRRALTSKSNSLSTHRTKNKCSMKILVSFDGCWNFYTSWFWRPLHVPIKIMIFATLGWNVESIKLSVANYRGLPIR